MTKKKITGLVILSLVGVMTLTSLAAATDTRYTRTNENMMQQSPDNSERGENIFKTKRGMINKNVLKSVLKLDDDQLKVKLAENDNNVYKLLEAYGKVEEYKTVYLKTIKEKLDKAVSDGKVTQDKADAIYAKAGEAMKSFNAETGSLDIKEEKPSFSFNSDDVQEGLGKAVEVFGELRNDWIVRDNNLKLRDGAGFSLGLDTNVISDIIGISTEELRTRLVEKDGNLFKVLEEMGKVEEYKIAALRMTKDALDKAVYDGRLTQEAADSIYERSKEVISNFDGENFSMFIHPESGEGVFKKQRDFFKKDKENKDDRGNTDKFPPPTVPQTTTENNI